MKVRFLPEADVEFRESARYYEDKAPGLGIAFITEVHRGLPPWRRSPILAVRWKRCSANLCRAVFRTT